MGAACVFFMRKELDQRIQRILTGFAAGVMVAASVWSLLIPAMEQEKEHMGRLAFMPAVLGFCTGIVLFLLLDIITPQLCSDLTTEGSENSIRRTTRMVLAVVLHNIPEGMAVGVVYAGLLTEQADITLMGALALSVGIAIQNFPEGAIVSMPMHAAGLPKGRAYMRGVLSGVVEPLAALVTILLSTQLIPLLPYLLSFAAGAMIYVVLDELVPEMARGKYSNLALLAFMVGFSLMMALDVALG